MIKTICSLNMFLPHTHYIPDNLLHTRVRAVNKDKMKQTLFFGELPFAFGSQP